MPRWKLAPLALTALLLAACTQTLAPTPDQSITPAAVLQTIDNRAGLSASYACDQCGVGQTFEVTVSGFITKVLFNSPLAGTGDLEIWQFDEAGTAPTALNQAQSISWVAGDNEITLTSPDPVTPGIFAFFVTSDIDSVYLNGAGSDGYPGGGVWFGSESAQLFPLWPPNPVGPADLYFTVIIEDLIDDTTPPDITTPADVTLEAPAMTDPASTGIATATDLADPNPTISFSDVLTLSGTCPANFVIDRTWTATDDTGNSASAIQKITSQDTTTPNLTVPPDVTLFPGESTDPSNTGTATATDAADPNPTIGFSDNVNGNIVRTWTATDACGNAASSVQTITVLTAQEALEILIAEVQDLGLRRGIENSLTRKLTNAIRNLDDGLDAEAVEKIVSFIDQVNAQVEKKIMSAGDAASLIALAQRILAGI